MTESYASAMSRHVREMAEQSARMMGGLFPPDNGSETSKEAAARVAPHVTEQEQRVLDALKDKPMTRQELAEAAGLKENSVNGRANALLARGLIYEQGKRDHRAILHFGTQTWL